MMRAAESLSARVGIVRACTALRVSRASLYRRRRVAHTADLLHSVPAIPACAAALIATSAVPLTATALLAPSHPRALSAEDRAAVLNALTSERFVDQAPASVHAVLLDEGRYLCSVRTMYRILAAAKASRERRDQRRRPQYTAPQLLATAPNQVWSWDITKLLGPAKFEYFHLYVMLDIFSRYVVGWLVADRESGALAKALISQCFQTQAVAPDQLKVHSDRGAAMMSKPVVSLLESLGIEKTVSRPHVSNDNPFIESHFKTLKYRPCVPDRFGSSQDVRATMRPLFAWYNTAHRHSGIAYMTPEAVHYGRTAAIESCRDTALLRAYRAHPERFVRGRPRPAALPGAVWINPPPAACPSPMIDQDYPDFADARVPAGAQASQVGGATTS